MTQPNELVKFKIDTHYHYTCYVLSSAGMKLFSEKLSKSDKMNPNGVFQIGNSERDANGKRIAFSEMKNHKVVSSLKSDGDFSDTIAKSLIVLMYSLWDELYRPKIAVELKVNTADVLANLMGDIRLIRNCIVHKKSQVTNECEKMTELTWPNKKGELRITDKMMEELKSRINIMQILVK